MNGINRIEAAEAKFHNAVRVLFYYVTLIHSWFTQPIITFKIVFMGMKWIPVKNMKGYFFKEDGGVIRIRHKKLPGEYRFAATRRDYGNIFEEVVNYFEG